MLRPLVIISSLIIILAFVIGCDDRGSNLTTNDLGDLSGWEGMHPGAQHTFTPALTLQLRNKLELLLATVYWPPEAEAVPTEHPIPLLVLLAPEGGNKFYYFAAGLSELIRELTASGEIQPMVVYCMSNDITFGGFFYGDSDPAGHYDSIFYHTPGTFAGGGRDDLLQMLHRFYPATIELPSKRGIGGIGQGSYGAFRALIKNPGLFSSISVTDGPLDFDGGMGNQGLTDLFGAVADEQRAHYAMSPKIDSIITTIVGTDTTRVTIFFPFEFKRDFDSSITMPLSQMIIGGAFAFSPNDTLMTYERRSSTTFNQDGTVSRRVWLENLVREQIADSLLPGGGDSTTFIGNMISSGERTRFIDLDFHLPFDGSGNPPYTTYAPIWDRWMANNLEDMHIAEGSSPLTDVSMWFGTNRDAKWGYYGMTQSWMNYLKTAYPDDAITEYQYSGYGGNHITEDEYLFDILREMLIFHSNNFGD